MNGRVQVEDYKREGEREDMEPYQVERIATVLAVLCMFLSVLYTIFAILLFLCYASQGGLTQDDKMTDVATSHAQTPLVSVSRTGVPDQHQLELEGPGFITMENSSQGTST